MNKLFAIMIAALFAFSTTYASPDYGSSALTESGAGTQDGVSGIDDLSYDESEGNYCIYVICPLTLTPMSENHINLGYINPDGSRGLANEYMQWSVTGGDGWFFEAWMKNDQFATNSSGTQSMYVYFVNPYWTYQMGNSSPYMVGGAPVSGEYDQEYTVGQLQLSGQVGGEDQGSNPCEGMGYFTFYPNQVVATELATTDMYTWNVFLGVDYLTWTTPVDPDGTAYTQPVAAP